MRVLNVLPISKLSANFLPIQISKLETGVNVVKIYLNAKTQTVSRQNDVIITMHLNTSTISE